MTSTSHTETPQLPDITKLNELGREDFFKVVNILFETAPPLADALFQARPFSSYHQLIDKAEEIISKLSHSQRLEVINAHPRIGMDPTQIRTRSVLSYKEQGCDKEETLSQMDRQEIENVYRKLKELNDRYEKKFGFRFVVWVAGRPKSAIIPILEQRLNNTASEELNTGLKAMLDIARDRLSKLLPQNKL